jgi:putative DNA primase/helicase
VQDAEVARARRVEGDGDAQGHAIKLPEPEPWPEPVNGSKVLDEALSATLRHMVMRPEDGAAAVLWAAHTHVFDRFSYSPRLLITAPDAECGKTVLLFHIVGNLVTRPQPVELMKAPPLFRLAEAHRPTFLIDEMDVFIKEDSDLLAAVNNGWEPHGGVLRCVGDAFEVRKFSTFSPVAMAGIRLIEKLPATTISRSVVISLDRDEPGEIRDEDIYDRRKHRAHLHQIARKLARWTRDQAEAIHACDPQLPARVRNRLADKWRPLFALAEVAGGHWPAKARAALLAQASDKEPSKALQLLIDIRDVTQGMEVISTADLINRLCLIEDSPWESYNFRERDADRRRITSRQLSALLRPYKVHPVNVRIGGSVPKGYRADDLRKAWARYLPEGPPPDPPHRYNSPKSTACGEADPLQPKPGVADVAEENPSEIRGCSGVAGSEGGTAEGGCYAGEL